MAIAELTDIGSSSNSDPSLWAAPLCGQLFPSTALHSDWLGSGGVGPGGNIHECKGDNDLGGEK